MPAHRLLMLGATDDVLLNLLKLMHSHDALRVFAIGAGLAAEARRPGDIANRQIGLAQDFAAVHAGDRNLRRTHQEQFILRQRIGLLAATRELTVADEAELFG